MKSITIGRGSENDVVVPDDCASRKHCQIIQDNDGRFRLIDFRTPNGTYVNGVKRHGEISLNETDRVKIGNSTVPWFSYFTGGVPLKTPQKSGGFGIAALVCGIVGVCVVAIPFGVIGWQRDRKNRGLAIAGFILGCVWALIGIIYWIVVATTVHSYYL